MSEILVVLLVSLSVGAVGGDGSGEGYEKKFPTMTQCNAEMDRITKQVQELRRTLGPAYVIRFSASCERQ